MCEEPPMTQKSTTRELGEIASLDALGPLSEEEREALDSAFRAAPPELIELLRREQARIAENKALFSPMGAPSGLRARVLHSIRGAIRPATSEPATGGMPRSPIRAWGQKLR